MRFDWVSLLSDFDDESEGVELSILAFGSVNSDQFFIPFDCIARCFWFNVNTRLVENINLAALFVKECDRSNVGISIATEGLNTPHFPVGIKNDFLFVKQRYSCFCELWRLLLIGQSALYRRDLTVSL